MMESKAKLVIIGAGIVGCSAAYHLTKMGWKDVVVIDQGPLYETGGSTSHAPGLVFQTNTSRMFSKFAQYTVELCDGLDWDGEQVWYGVGGVELIDGEPRRMEIHRRNNANKAYGLESYVISPAEVKEKVRLIDETKIGGGLYVPSDGDLKSWKAAGAMARKAIATGGAKFYGNTNATDIELKNGRVHAVMTDQGRIECEQILLCTNIWGEVLADKVGVKLPFRACSHPVAITEPLPEFGEFAADSWCAETIVRHQSHSLYFRPWDQGYSLGSYKHPARLTNSYQVGKDAYNVWDDGEWAAGEAEMYNIFPTTRGKKWAEKYTGMFVFSVDGYPMMGKTQIPGFWTCVGVWVTHSGGAGKSIAEWMTHGHTEWDVREGNVMRFQQFQGTKRYVEARTAQNYKEIYDIIHPKEPYLDPRNVRLVPYHDRLVAQGGQFLPSAGWEMAQWYESNVHLLEKYKDRVPHRKEGSWEAKFWSPIQGAEHLAARDGTCLFNIANFTKIEVRGSGALSFLERVCANRMDVPVNKIVYTALCDNKGGIRADLTITRRSDDTFWVLTGAGTGPSDLFWLQQHLSEFGDDGTVVITDISAAYSGVALWGQQARDVLGKLVDEDISSISNEAFPYFRAREIVVDTIPCYALRLSYIGELGWEIYCPADQAVRLWDLLWEAGQDVGIFALGSGAFNSLRIEKGYRAWGSDIHTDYNPFEAGLGFAVRMKKKSDFLGRDMLVEARKDVTRKLCCMTLDEPDAVAMGKEPILDGDTAIGYVTSADYGYSVGKFLLYGYLPVAYAEEGKKVQIRYFDRVFGATVAADPIFDPEMARLKA